MLPVFVLRFNFFACVVVFFAASFSWADPMVSNGDIFADLNAGVEIATNGGVRGATYFDFSGLVKKLKPNEYLQFFKVYGEFMPGPTSGPDREANGVPRLDLIFVPFLYLKKSDHGFEAPIIGGPSFEIFRDTLLKNFVQYNLRAFQIGFSKVSESDLQKKYFVTASVNMGGWEYVELNKGAGDFGIHGLYVAGVNANIGYFFHPGSLEFRHTVLSVDASFGTAGTQGTFHTDVDFKLPTEAIAMFPYLRVGGRFDGSFDLLDPDRPELADAHPLFYGFFQFGVKGGFEFFSPHPVKEPSSSRTAKHFKRYRF